MTAINVKVYRMSQALYNKSTQKPILIKQILMSITILEKDQEDAEIDVITKMSLDF